jgi:hypothetical protein
MKHLKAKRRISTPRPGPRIMYMQHPMAHGTNLADVLLKRHDANVALDSEVPLCRLEGKPEVSSFVPNVHVWRMREELRWLGVI